MVFNLQQDSGNGKLGLGEFATLWKKVQRYLVSLNTPASMLHMQVFSSCFLSVSSASTVHLQEE